MGGLFKQPKLPPPPKPVRMPNETDPEVQAAAARARENALKRTGRLSTIMTTNLGAAVQQSNPEKASTGSSGVKLGA